jgi:hypothetical protein
VIHTAPQVDFMGVILAQSLEVGQASVNGRRSPAVRFHLLQNGGKYPLVALGRVAAEIYAYCLVALEQGITEIHVKTYGTLLMDIGGRSIVSVSDVTWYTSSEMREQAAASILKVIEGQGMKPPRFKNVTGPLMQIET